MQDLIEEKAKGTALPHISITAFAGFPGAVPPLAEQQEIVHCIDALFAAADGRDYESADQLFARIRAPQVQAQKKKSASTRQKKART